MAVCFLVISTSSRERRNSELNMTWRYFPYQLTQIVASRANARENSISSLMRQVYTEIAILCATKGNEVKIMIRRRDF